MERREIGFHSLLTVASVVVVVAGMKAAASLITPFMLAVFLSVLAIPPARWLQERGLPPWASFVVVFVSIIGGLAGMGYFLGDSVADFTAHREEYADILRTRMGPTFDWLSSQGIEMPEEGFKGQLEGDQLMSLLSGAVGALGAVVANSLFVILMVGFMLAEAAGLPSKIRMALGDPGADIGRFSRIMDDVNRYLWVKTLVSLITGLLAWALCAVVQIEYPFLWGLIAFLLNYIPQLGSYVAAVPPILLALVQYDLTWATVVAVGYIAINVLMANIIEPQWLGRTLGLSTLVVFMSLLFWGFIFGPIGMFLSVPLTMVVKVSLEHSDDLQWVAILLGSGKETRERVEAAESGIHLRGTATVTSRFDTKSPGD